MKQIGIVGYPQKEGYGIPNSYLVFLSYFGVVSIIMPNEKEIRPYLDLLVLPGGPDVDSKRYLGERPLSLTMGYPCPFRERFDNVLLPKYIENETPIFGICRGHQTLAVHFGGTLKQHMVHETSPSIERTKKVHWLKLSDDVSEYVPGISALQRFEVNSLHHQVIDKLPENATAIALYDSNNANKEVEAIGYTNYPAVTVQWHPEEIWDEFSMRAIKKLLKLYENES
jgi:putative glutamine amidotransferase